MLRFGYTKSNADHTLFIRKKRSLISILILYVDDIVLTGNDHVEIKRLKDRLAKEFKFKDLGDLRFFLGIEVVRSSKGIFLSRQKYILDLLTETGMLGCQSVNTPVDPKHGLHSSKGEQVNKDRYQRIVGRFVYLSHTRPDIAFTVSLVSQYMHDPRESHYVAVLRILRYLKGCPGKGILLSNHDHLRVEVYTDADWAGSHDDSRSTSGYCSFIGGKLVTWRNKKQDVVARSSAEAEYH